MKKRIVAFILALTALFGALILKAEALDISGSAAVLISADTGEVLYEKNADTRLPMASTTKIMTALVTLENADLDDTVTVSPEAAGIEGSSIYLYAGEKISVESLLYALMLESANDAAAALAIHVAGSVADFAALMNKKADELSLVNTHFTNPHGLYDDEHYTSARDLALIAIAALGNEKFREIVSTEKKSVPMEDGSAARLFINHNKLLRTYGGAIGVKTGFTKKSGRCLVSAAERDGMTFVAVTLSAPDDWRDHAALLDYAFSCYEKIKLEDALALDYTLPVVGGEIDFIKCKNKEDVYAYIKKDNKNITKTVELRRFYFAGIKKGDVLGRVCYYNNGKMIAKAELVALFDGPRKIYSFSIFELSGERLKG